MAARRSAARPAKPPGDVAPGDDGQDGPCRAQHAAAEDEAEDQQDAGGAVPDQRIADQGGHRAAVVIMRYCALDAARGLADLRSAT